MSEAITGNPDIINDDPNVTKWGDRKTIDDYTAVPAWAANATRYEWSDDFGDVGPEDEELEKMLFQAEDKMEVGDQLEKLTDIKVNLESEIAIEPVVRFDDAGLHPTVLENVKRCGFKIPTPIQAYCLPAVLKNLDVIGIAQTGQLHRSHSFTTLIECRIRQNSCLSYPYHLQADG